jgi:cell shape-determining protein MreD
VKPAPSRERDLARFAPRITVTLIAGFAIFMLAALVYVLPVLLDTPPPGAVEDYQRERVMARLEGRLPWLIAGSFLAATLLSIRGWLPGTGRRG